MGGGGGCIFFGRTLRRARRARDMSQETLAREAGVGAKHVSELERGNKNPRLDTFVRLAGALGMTATELMARYEHERG